MRLDIHEVRVAVLAPKIQLGAKTHFGSGGNRESAQDESFQKILEQMRKKSQKYKKFDVVV